MSDTEHALLVAIQAELRQNTAALTALVQALDSRQAGGMVTAHLAMLDELQRSVLATSKRLSRMTAEDDEKEEKPGLDLESIQSLAAMLAPYLPKPG